MLGYIAPLKKVEYVVYGDLIIIYPKSYSIHLGRTTSGISLSPKP